MKQKVKILLTSILVLYSTTLNANNTIETTIALDNENNNKYIEKERFSILADTKSIFGDTNYKLNTKFGVESEQYNKINFIINHKISENSAVRLNVSKMSYKLDEKKVGTDTVIYEGWNENIELTYSKYHSNNIHTQFGLNQNILTQNIIENYNNGLLVRGLDNIATFNASIEYKINNNYKFNFKAIKALEDFAGSMTQEDLDNKENDTTFPLEGPIKYGKYLNPSFAKIYYSLNASYKIPYNSSIIFVLKGDYTKDRVPKMYEYNTIDYEGIPGSMLIDGSDYGYSKAVTLKKDFINSISSIYATLRRHDLITRNLDNTSSHNSQDHLKVGIKYTNEIISTHLYYNRYNIFTSKDNNIDKSFKFLIIHKF